MNNFSFEDLKCDELTFLLNDSFEDKELGSKY